MTDAFDAGESANYEAMLDELDTEDPKQTVCFYVDEFAELMNYACLYAIDHPSEFAMLREFLADKDRIKAEDPRGYAAVVDGRSMWLGATFRLNLEKRRLGMPNKEWR